MANIPDITKTEQWILKNTMKERYGKDIEISHADAEIRLQPADREPSACPAVYWQADNCNFVIFKTGERNYRRQFFYRGYQQYGTGVREYDNLSECAVTLPQVQADHHAREQGKI